MLNKIEIGFSKIVCSDCDAAIALKDFEASQGNCNCGSQMFEVTLLVRKYFKYSSDSPGGRGSPPGLSAMAMLGGPVGAAAVAARAFNNNDSVRSSVEDREHILSNLSSETVFALAEAQPQQVVDFISGLRKEAAKANLRDGQGICKECESVYTIAYKGPTAQGYCSPICQSKYEREHPGEAPAAAAPQKASVIKCPKCAKSTKIRPGKENVCMWCGTPV